MVLTDAALAQVTVDANRIENALRQGLDVNATDYGDTNTLLRSAVALRQHAEKTIVARATRATRMSDEAAATR